MINMSSSAYLLLVLILFQNDVTALQIVHGQGRKSHYNNTAIQPSRYQPLELKSLGTAGNSQYQLRHNTKYDFWFFTNPRFNGPHTDSMLNSEGMMMEVETTFAVERIQAALLKNNGTCTVIDVGSNYGYFSLLSLRLGCRVYAFEPAKNNFDLSILNFKMNNFKNWVAVNHPVGPGTDLLFDGWSSMNLNSQNKEATKGVTSVPLSFLQQFFTDNPNSNNNNSKNESPTMVIDWLKVDVEGYEQEVLKTVPSSMSVSSLSIEVSHYP